MTLNITKAETDIDFLFNNFRVVANERTTEKLFKFLFQILKTLDTKDNQLERLKNEYMKYSIPEGEEEGRASSVGPIKSGFEFVNPEEEKSMFELLMQRRQDYLVREKGITTIVLEKLQEKRRLTFRGKINSIEIWIPVEWDLNEAKLMAIRTSANIEYESYNHKDYYINNLTNLIFKAEQISSVDQAKVKLIDSNVRVESFKMSDMNELASRQSVAITMFKPNFVRTNILKCSKVELSFESESKPQENESDSSVVLRIHPIDLQVGFIEVSEFSTVKDRIMGIVDGITEQNAKIISKIQDEYDEYQNMVKPLILTLF